MQKYETEVEDKNVPFYKACAEDLVRMIAPFAPHFAEELWEIRDKLIPYMENAETGVDANFFMLTDIMKESTELLFFGKRAKQMIEDAFFVRAEDIKDEHSCILRNVVSRKKQVVPAIVGSLQH